MNLPFVGGRWNCQVTGNRVTEDIGSYTHEDPFKMYT
jgi:hypothetical protein